MSEALVGDSTPVELRVHGVSGTPVESMLRHPHPVQVAGDRLAGCYRRGDDHADASESPPTRPRVLEAYSWGRLTAGPTARAFWLLLLPFTLVNVASWVHPARAATRSNPVGIVAALTRLLALMMTGMLVLAACVLGMDLVAWQCGADAPRCASRHFFSSFLTDGFWAAPGRRVLAGAVVPLVVVAVLAWLSRGTGRSYEEYPERMSAGGAGGVPTGDTNAVPLPLGARDLAARRFWSGGKPLRRLRSLHVTVALATIGVVAAYGVSAQDADARPLGRIVTVVGGLLVAVAAALVVSPFVGRRRQLIAGKRVPAWIDHTARVLPVLGLAVAAAGLGYAGFVAQVVQRPGSLPGLHAAVGVLGIAQFVVTLVIAAATWFAWRAVDGDRRETHPRFFGGYGNVALALLGVALLAAYAAGVAFRLADYLGRPVAAGCEPDCPRGATETVLLMPQRYVENARLFFFAVLLWVVGVVVALVTLRRRAKSKTQLVVADYGPHPEDPDRVRTIARFYASASMSDAAGAMVAIPVLGTVVVALLLFVGADSMDADALSFVTTVGTWLAGVFALALVVLGRQAYRSDSLRRTVGIVWDLATFWPRACHPFAPPCYCERTVPELARRVTRLVREGRPVILSAHSQGSVISVATVLQLPADVLPRVALLTYGSPLCRFYGRLFPHFFGSTELAAVRGLLGRRWLNLYRRSDPIGGPVFARDQDVPTPDGVDVRVVDPTFERDEYELTWPRALRHSDYQFDRRFAACLDELAAGFDVAPPKADGRRSVPAQADRRNRRTAATPPA